jgi:hypothetical protein
VKTSLAIIITNIANAIKIAEVLIVFEFTDILDSLY